MGDISCPCFFHLTMASLLQLLILFAITSSFTRCLAHSSRKELRNEEIIQVDLDYSNHSERIDPSRVVQLSWRPRVFWYRGFLTDEECDHLIHLANIVEEKTSGNDDKSRNNIKEVNKESGNSVTKRWRTSSVNHSHMEVFQPKPSLLYTTKVFSDASLADVLARIEERISAWTFLPKENGRPLQVMHYALEEAQHKLDDFNKSTLETNEPLMATLVLYLSNVPRGGEILFPESVPKSKSWSDCTKISDILKPVKGNAILFFSVHPNASLDKSSTHSRCPVLEGEMWCATKFFRLRPIRPKNVPAESDSGDCTDEDENCPNWAAIGECKRNPVFMIGSPDYYGTCRKSCKAC